MKPRRILAPLALAALAACPATALAQDAPGADMDAAMQELQKTMMPGAPHRELEFYAGDWNLVTHADMGGEQVTTEGTAHSEMMLGGRFVHAVHHGEMWGMPFEGVGITGYDNVKKQYFNVWFDSMGTGVLVSYGNKNADGALELTGTYDDPMMGTVDYRMVTTVTGEDSYTFDMYMKTPEGEQRAMDILYTRAKK